MLTHPVSLQSLHTFHLAVNAAQLLTIDTAQALRTAWLYARQSNTPSLLLGGGSNVLFLEDFTGTVLLNRIGGIELTETEDAWLLRVGAGENWHQLVSFTLAKGIGGLENLALIPGCAGSAPIQNIGAYGVELQQVCDYVELLDLEQGESIRLTNPECCFGYRDSVFKHRYRQGYAITHLGLKLKKKWQPVLNYGELKQLDPETITPQKIFQRVCEVRSSKLPDPSKIGNAGSFFKNPLVTAEQADSIAQKLPAMPRYPQADGRVKLAAGWLIDQCGLKGYQLGGAAVHPLQALVLINQNNATGREIVALAHYIRQQVFQRFQVLLEPEVRFIAATGEVDAVEAIA